MKKQVLCCLAGFAILMLGVGNALAVPISATTSGNWNSASTWARVTRTGTITTSSSSTAVTGVSTSFTTELAVGSIVTTIGGTVIGTVQSITSNTQLTLTANAASSNSGISYNAQVVPTSSDAVTIGVQTNVVTVNTASATCASLVVGPSNDGLLALVINSPGVLTVVGNLTVGTGSGAGKDGGVDLSSGGYLKIGGAFTHNGNKTASVLTGGTVEYNGAGPQLVLYATAGGTGASPYGNLILSGSGLKTIATASITINGVLSIAPTGTAKASIANGVNFAVGTLKLGGVVQVSGTWGSSISAATHKTDTYFDVATTGIVTLTPAAASQLQVETASDGTGTVVPAQNVTAGSSITVYAITRDTFGNFVANVSATWSLQSITAGVVSGDLVGGGASAVFTGRVVGTAIIQAVATFTGQSGVQTVVPGAATKLVFTTTAVTVTAGVASGTITVQRQDAFNNPNTADANRTVTLSSSSSGTVTFTPASPLTIANGSSTTSFTYTDTKSGSPTITAASTSPSTITSATQLETVNPAAHSAFRITPNGSPTAGSAYALTITAVDQFQNTVTSVTGDHNFTFAGLTTADDGTLPTVTSKTGSAVTLGTAELITFASGVSSAGGSLIAYKAESATLTGSDSTSGKSTAGTGGTGASLTIANANPVATTHSFTRTTGSSLKILKTALLAGATDANHDVISFSSVQSPSGDATVFASGTLVYYSPGTTGDGATFTYTVSDGHSGTDTKTVTVNVASSFGVVTITNSGNASVTLSFYGIPGSNYFVQRSVNLSTWADASGALTAPSSGLVQYTDVTPPNPSYYRTRSQ